jgi:endonuclease/exonuclease/phosphatase (EEP) superfamily protein YafD
VRRFARVGTCLVAACYAVGLLGAQSWLLDLFSHFRVQYAALLAVVALALTLLRDARFAIAAWIASCWVGWPLMRSAVPTQATAGVAQHAAATLKVVTLNAWYRNDDTPRIARYLDASGADLVLVQEFDSARMRELIAALRSYPHHAMEAAADRHGAAVLSRWPIEAAASLPLARAKRHAQWARLQWDGTSIEVVAVHLPWPLGGDSSRVRNAELDALADWMRQAQRPVIVGGDFNQTPWSRHFARALRHAGAASALAANPDLGTWPTTFPPLGIQIDHCFVSRDWHVVGVRRGPNVGSDHYPVEVVLQLQPPTLRGSLAG